MLRLAYELRVDGATDFLVDLIERWWSGTNLSRGEMIAVLARCHNGLVASQAFVERDSLDGAVLTVASAWERGAPGEQVQQ